MIDKFVKRFNEKTSEIKQGLREMTELPSYGGLFRMLCDALHDEDDYDTPNSATVQRVSYGDYEGTLVFIVANSTCYPSEIWFTHVRYGSCSACDTLQGVHDRCKYSDDYSCRIITDDAVDGYHRLMLHMLQNMKEVM